MEPSFAPKQLISNPLKFDLLNEKSNSSGSFKTKTWVSKQPFESVTLTVYVPAVKPVWSWELESKPEPFEVVQR